MVDKDEDEATKKVKEENISPNPAADEEDIFFNKRDKDDELKRRLKLKNDRQEEDNLQSKRYARRAYRFSKIWVGFLLVFIPVQMILKCFKLGLSDPSFIAVIGSLSASILGYWWLVGRYLFPSNPK